MNKFQVEVPGVGVTLESNQIYHIREVSDTQAPDGFKRKGISNHPLPGIHQGIVVPYHESTRSWDTGFFKNSFCYRGIQPIKVGKTLKTLEDNLLKELDGLIEGDLRDGKSSNNKLFDSFIPFNGTGNGEDVSKYKIKGGNMFNTSNPLEFLALWFALLGKQIIPSDKRGKPGYRDFRFVLEDKKVSTSLETDREFENIMALSTVTGVVTSGDKKSIAHLENVLQYLNFQLDIQNVAPKPAITMFSKWAKKGGIGTENAQEFNEVYNYFQEDENKEELIAYVELVKAIKDSRVKLERGDIIVAGENLGSDKKQAAKKISKNQELIKELLD